MADDHATHRGLYKNPSSPYWWMRVTVNGRKIRRTTKLKNIDDAIAYRESYLRQARIAIEPSEWTAWVDSQLENPQGWLRRTAARMARKSRLRGWGTSMDSAELAHLLKRSEGRCSISGVRLQQPTCKGEAGPYNVSVDRIDSSAGYTLGNCRVVCLLVNLSMRTWGEETVRNVARSIVATELTASLDRAEVWKRPPRTS